MTVEELLDLPAPDLAAMSDAQLEEHLRPYFPHTRAAGVIGQQMAEMESDPVLAAALAEAAAARKKGAFKISQFIKK